MILNWIGSSDGEASFVQWIVNGVRINWGNAPAGAYLVTATFFAGSDVTAKAGTFTASSVQDGSVDVNGVGFEPNLTFVAGARRVLQDQHDSDAYLSFGWCANISGTPQGCFGFFSGSGLGTTDVQGVISDSYALRYPGGHAVELSGFDAQGFTAITRLVAPWTGWCGTAYLALAFSGVEVWAGPISSKTSNGDQPYSTPGLTPQAVFMLPSFLTAYDAVDASGLGGTTGFSTLDEDDEYCSSIQDEDGQGTSDTQSLSDNTAINLPQDDGSAGFVASFVSLNAGSWTINFTTTDGTIRKWFAAAVGTCETLTTTTTLPGVYGAGLVVSCERATRTMVMLTVAERAERDTLAADLIARGF
jgi:hypothetical protein